MSDWKNKRDEYRRFMWSLEGGITFFHSDDAINDALLKAHDVIADLLDQVEKSEDVINCAKNVVQSPVWEGVSDEDCELEESLRAAGWLPVDKGYAHG